ncbi:uncharacterized protein [Miscanthus floridulus]|uniref:uncharacterized protein n=1 Tax=Miscanthus floridulus TaxID=154761 RepID=UPI003458728B
MAQVVFNHVGGKPPFFDDTSSFDYWKRKMRMYLGSIHEKVWDVVENEFVMLNPMNLTDNDKINKQYNTMALNTIYNVKETYEGTKVVKSAKIYMLKNQLNNFKIKDDKTILELFYRLQVIINDLKSLGEKTKDEDFSHKFLMCLPKRFKTLRTILFRGGLEGVSPNEVLDDVMTKDQYNDDEEDEKKDEDNKKKSVVFKATSSSSKNKGKGKAKKEESNDDSNGDDKKTSKKKALASTAINNKPSLFDSPSCFMAKSTKVKYDVSDDDDDARDDSNNDSDDDEPTVEQLMDMLEQAKSLISSKSKKCKELSKKLKALEQSFNEISASHECIKEDHEDLKVAHTKLEKAHSSLQEQN